MKLSEAIRLGAMLKPQGFGSLVDSKGATCALGAADEAVPMERYPWLITGPLDIRNVQSFRGQPVAVEPGGIDWVVRAPSEWRGIYFFHSGCPVCDQKPEPVFRVIPHLNDTHKWTREQIADWVEAIERAQEPSHEGLDSQSVDHARTLVSVGAETADGLSLATSYSVVR